MQVAPEDAALALVTERLARQVAADAVAGAMRRGLVRWTALAGLGSLAALLLERPDAALFLAAAALFALAQSWDVRDRARTGDPLTDAALLPGLLGSALRALVPLVVPFAGALGFCGLIVFARGLPRSAPHLAAMQWCIAATAVCVLSAFPPFARALARTFVSGSRPGHTDRLTASVALVLLLVPVPFQLLSEELMGIAKGSGRPLADVGSLVTQLLGEVVFALSAVGLWVGRDLRAVRERLGLGGMGAQHLFVAVAGFAAVSGLNLGMEWIERTQLHALWLRDQDIVRLIAGDMSVAAAVVLGISAGVGEEILVRGALQPRVGLVWASLLFAAAHVQYTWFGMLTIVLLGVTLGLVRKCSNTTTAIVVHMLYDTLAALGAR
ncbi:MAG TPA: CPBP family intramembrane glutamic endopeptidase [Candidatus Eisenbacteria bacterium]|jgi:membrane protease YdiL (CAAX protease family)